DGAHDREAQFAVAVEKGEEPLGGDGDPSHVLDGGDGRGPPPAVEAGHLPDQLTCSSDREKAGVTVGCLRRGFDQSLFQKDDAFSTLTLTNEDCPLWPCFPETGFPKCLDVLLTEGRPHCRSRG